MTSAEQAFHHWQKTLKVSMQVFTDQQIFELGFNAALSIINEMEKVIKDMDRENQKMAAEIKKLRKPTKDESA